MRKVLGQAAIALVLFAVGYVSWTVGQLQNRVADAHEELALLRYNAANASYADIEASMGYVSRVPWVADSLLSDVRGDHATGDYWLARYHCSGPRAMSEGPSSSGRRASWCSPPTPVFAPANAKAPTARRCWPAWTRRSRPTPSC